MSFAFRKFAAVLPVQEKILSDSVGKYGYRFFHSSSAPTKIRGSAAPAAVAMALWCVRAWVLPSMAVLRIGVFFEFGKLY